VLTTAAATVADDDDDDLFCALVVLAAAVFWRGDYIARQCETSPRHSETLRDSGVSRRDFGRSRNVSPLFG
jgi:hypothetical protein